MNDYRNPDKPIICPRCRSKIVTLTQHTEKLTQYQQNDHYQICLTSAAQTERRHVTGTCEICKHHWRLRGVSDLQNFKYLQQQIQK